jgi:hypothetical protein
MNKQIPSPLTWCCIAVGVVAAAVILLFYGLSAWTLVALVLLVACPLVVARVLLLERGYSPTRSGTKK